MTVYIEVTVWLYAGGGQAARGVQSALPVVPRYRTEREAVCIHHAHSAGPVHSTCVPLRAQLRGSLQDYRSRLQGQ